MRLLAATVLALAASVLTSALPTSLVADAQDATTKAKRVDEEMMFGNQQNKPSASGVFYSPVSKRAVKPDQSVPTVFLPTETPAAEVEDTDASRRVISHPLSDVDLIAHMRRGAMDRDENSKTLHQYEKGYLYGVGKEALDKKAENALLKSEIYGEPVNEYRYYGGGDAHRQTRVTPKKHSIYSAADIGARLKRDLELDPESLLALISLWQAQRSPNYRDRSEFSRYGYERPEENEGNDDEEEPDNGEWLESPVPLSRYQYDVNNQYPMGSHYGMVDNYPNIKSVYYPPLTRVEHKRGQWGGFSGYAPPEKRFMVSKRRQFDRWEEPSVWSRLLASQPRDPMPGMTAPRRRVLL